MYSAEVMRRARQKLADAKADKQSRYQQDLQTAYARQPRLKQIDLELRRSMAAAAQAAFLKGENAQQQMEQVKQANLQLQQERQAIISSQFPQGFLDDSPICPHCGGTGYIGSAMCRCLQQLCLQEQMRQLALLTSGQERFENFELSYYPEQVDRNFGASPRTIMQLNLKNCRKYADGFGPGSGNLLFVGNTGLGKTFLSACIANEVAQKGYSVAYETAPRLFSKLEKDRFNADEQTHAEVDSLNSCDLLIIDDLGTELPGNFVTAALYNLVNDRLLAGKSMIISTNLNVEEIARRYSPQIASRLQGNFHAMTFVGEDIRVLKNRGR